MLIKVLKKQVVHTSLKKLCFIGALGMVGYFTIPLLHYSYSGEFFWSKGKNVFLTGRINQMGLLKPFLQDYCPHHTYSLCSEIETIPFDLLWDVNSPLQRTGGWMANDEQYGRMLNDFFSDLHYLKKFAIKSIESMVMQIFTFEGQIIYKETENGYPYAVMQDVCPEQIPAYRRSMQFSEEWSSKPTQFCQRILVFISFLTLFILLYTRTSVSRSSKQTNQICLFITLALFCNAIFCASISEVDIRFQYRIIWLVPLLAMMIAADQFIKDRSFKNQA